MLNFVAAQRLPRFQASLALTPRQEKQQPIPCQSDIVLFGQKRVTEAELQKQVTELKTRVALISRLREAADALSFEMQTWQFGAQKTLPAKAVVNRGEQLAALSTVSHRLLMDPDLNALLITLERSLDRLSWPDRRLVEVMLADAREASKIPESFVERETLLKTKSFKKWQEARSANNGAGDFSLFAPVLTEVIALQRELSDILAPEAVSPYDALLERYEPGMNTRKMDALFADLKQELLPLIHRIQRTPQVDDAPLKGHSFSLKKQYEAVLMILSTLGFDFDRASVAVADRPFCMWIAQDDNRLAVSLQKRNLWMAISSAAHECGHLKYQLGVDPVWKDTPLREGTSIGIHESQSRLHELMLAQGRSFISYYFPKLQAMFPRQLGQVTEDEFYRAVNKVYPSLNRIEADEVTYLMHVMVRYEIEKDLFEGTLEVEDVPEAWNRKMKDYLGVEVPGDAQGCLQDVHWSKGMFGYFPTYAIGTLGAAQFFQHARKAIPDLDQQLASGDVSALTRWLNENVHKNGRAEKPSEIFLRATGEPLNAKYFIDYLKAKYSEIYGVDLAG